MVPQGRSRLSEGDEVGVFGGLPHHHHAGKGHLAQLALEKGGFVRTTWWFKDNVVMLEGQHGDFGETTCSFGRQNCDFRRQHGDFRRPHYDTTVLGDNMMIAEGNMVTYKAECWFYDHWIWGYLFSDTIYGISRTRMWRNRWNILPTNDMKWTWKIWGGTKWCPSFWWGKTVETK
jgi:hypothetical protein